MGTNIPQRSKAWPCVLFAVNVQVESLGCKNIKLRLASYCSMRNMCECSITLGYFE